MEELNDLLSVPGISLEGPEDVEAATDFCQQRGWGDGLPVVPPTSERVEKMLAFCDRPINVPVGFVPPRNGAATPVRLAANAVMAGCRPDYFPVLLTAIEAMCEESFNLYGLQTTTHPAAPLVIVNGPIAKELEINAGHNAFGPGWAANATIGRAIRLCLLNVGGGKPALGDMATMGHPGKYSFLIAENERANPWGPLHTERGFLASSTTVTVVASESPHNINDHYSRTAEGILTMVAGTIATTGANNLYHHGEPVVAFCPEHARTIAADGLTKKDVRYFLYQRARTLLAKFSSDNIEGRFRRRQPDQYSFAISLDTSVPTAKTPDSFIIIVLGGAGKHSMYLPSFGPTAAVTRPLKLSNGEYAESVQDYAHH